MGLQATGIRLFHISERPGIEVFEPRPSPSYFDAIKEDVVFAISDRLLHNYLLPRDCPRVTYYIGPQTTEADKNRFFGESTGKFIITVPSEWYTEIKTTVLYCYEFAINNFTLLDECAGYYVSSQREIPIAIRTISDPINEILSLGVELRFTPSIIPLAEVVKCSSLNFSLIRMRNAKT
ncbi:MAG TPA: hypothetical protein VIM89_08450 [Mucilaginibacter sp.]